MDFLDHRQCVNSRPALHAVVGKNHIKGPFGKLPFEVFLRGDRFGLEFDSRTLETVKAQIHIVGIIVGNQKLQGFHGGGVFFGNWPGPEHG